MSKEDNLEKLKKNYKVLEEKFGLPSFNELNEDFQIEHIELASSDFLVREVRRMISEKLVGYLKFIETLMNPSGAPFFVYSIIKPFGKSEKEKLGEFYKKLAKRQIEIIKLDLVYDVKKEVIFIKEVFSEWKKMKSEIFDIISFAEANMDKKYDNGSRAYFG